MPTHGRPVGWVFWHDVGEGALYLVMDAFLNLH